MTTNSTLSNLEAQLAVLRASTAAPVKSTITESTAVSEPVSVNLNDLRSMIREVIAETKAESDVVPIKNYTLIEAISLALTEEDHTWLLTSDVIKGVANFIASVDGQELTRQFVAEYRNTYES
jgi:hypothetical protein